MDRAKFDNDSGKPSDFLRRNALDGFEVMQCGADEMAWYPPDSVIGVHMRYWPVCIDFFRGDVTALCQAFGTDDVWQRYYGARTRDEFVLKYREGLRAAEDAGAQYAVFHASHTSLSEIFTNVFSADSGEVIDEFIALINDVLDGFTCDMTLLFENLWYPGITLLDESLALKMMEEVHHPNKGFMLDIGHMMITNPALSSYVEAAEYIASILRDRPAMLSYIKGIHLNGALTGKYLQAVMQGEGLRDIEGSFWERYANAYNHVSRIDAHVPFADASIQTVLELVNPDYLVFELISEDLPELERYIAEQQKFCGFIEGID